MKRINNCYLHTLLKLIPINFHSSNIDILAYIINKLQYILFTLLNIIYNYVLIMSIRILKYIGVSNGFNRSYTIIKLRKS